MTVLPGPVRVTVEGDPPGPVTVTVVPGPGIVTVEGPAPGPVTVTVEGGGAGPVTVMVEGGVGKQVDAPAGALRVTVTVLPFGGQVPPPPPFVTVTVEGGAGGPVTVMVDGGVGKHVDAPAGALSVTVTVLPFDGQVLPPPPPLVTVTVCAGGAGGHDVPCPPAGVVPVQADQEDESRAKSGLAFASKL